MIIWECSVCSWMNCQLGDPSEPKPKLKPCAACEVYEAERKENEQDLCEHKEFEKGICTACDWLCEHQEMDDGYCIYCGKFVLGYAEPDDAWLESQKDII